VVAELGGMAETLAGVVLEWVGLTKFDGLGYCGAMNSVNVHDAKTHFSRLLARVADGESVVISKAGKPVAKLVPMDESQPARPIGFMAGAFSVPDDFNAMGADEIADQFEGQS